jgi:hypothetical protein
MRWFHSIPIKEASNQFGPSYLQNSHKNLHLLIGFAAATAMTDVAIERILGIHRGRKM